MFGWFPNFPWKLLKSVTFTGFQTESHPAYERDMNLNTTSLISNLLTKAYVRTDRLS